MVDLVSDSCGFWLTFIPNWAAAPLNIYPQESIQADYVEWRAVRHGFNVEWISLFIPLDAPQDYTINSVYVFKSELMLNI